MEGCRVRAVGAALALATMIPASAARAAGFQIFEQGARAMGMANAYSAQTGDPASIYFNPGAIAFATERDFRAGGTLIDLGDSTFRGLSPFPGPDERGDQQDRILVPPHFYWVEPVGERLVVGLGLNAPFGLATEWDDPDDWSGRFISERAELRALDLVPAVAWRPYEKLGVAFGLVWRHSDLDLRRRAAAVDPFTLQPAEVARVTLDTDFDDGIGWIVGVLHQPCESISWGLSYRSKIEIDYGGRGRLTQVPTGDPVFDALVADQFPFAEDLSVGTSIDFPDMASLGLAWRPRSGWELAFDLDWVGWSSFDRTDIAFRDHPELSTTIVSNWDDTRIYRLGASWEWPGQGEWRFGLFRDESPQPDASVGPLLPDADRTGYSAGFGFATEVLDVDLALMLVDFDERTTRSNDDGFFGSYQNEVWLLGTTIGW